MSQSATRSEGPRQSLPKVTGFCLMQLLLLVLNPLDLVMQPLVQAEGADHSDHVAELPTPGLGFLAHCPSRQI